MARDSILSLGIERANKTIIKICPNNNNNNNNNNGLMHLLKFKYIYIYIELDWYKLRHLL